MKKAAYFISALFCFSVSGVANAQYEYHSDFKLPEVPPQYAMHCAHLMHWIVGFPMTTQASKKMYANGAITYAKYAKKKLRAQGLGEKDFVALRDEEKSKVAEMARRAAKSTKETDEMVQKVGECAMLIGLVQ